MVEPGTRVYVKAGDGRTLLGPGTYIGETSVHFFQMPDGTLSSQRGAEEAPSLRLIDEMRAIGAEHVIMTANPKIELDSGKIVYGCQVWWEVIEDGD